MGHTYSAAIIISINECRTVVKPNSSLQFSVFYFLRSVILYVFGNACGCCGSTRVY